MKKYYSIVARLLIILSLISGSFSCTKAKGDLELSDQQIKLSVSGGSPADGWNFPYKDMERKPRK